MVTIKEIAQMLGVSPTTVSNVINGRTGKMSPQTRQRIEDALWENHYEVAGKNSRRGSSEENMVAVAFLCPSMVLWHWIRSAQSSWEPSSGSSRAMGGI